MCCGCPNGWHGFHEMHISPVWHCHLLLYRRRVGRMVCAWFSLLLFRIPFSSHRISHRYTKNSDTLIIIIAYCVMDTRTLQSNHMKCFDLASASRTFALVLMPGSIHRICAGIGPEPYRVRSFPDPFHPFIFIVFFPFHFSLIFLHRHPRQTSSERNENDDTIHTRMLRPNLIKMMKENSIAATTTSAAAVAETHPIVARHSESESEERKK